MMQSSLKMRLFGQNKTYVCKQTNKQTKSHQIDNAQSKYNHVNLRMNNNCHVSNLYQSYLYQSTLSISTARNKHAKKQANK